MLESAGDNHGLENQALQNNYTFLSQNMRFPRATPLGGLNSSLQPNSINDYILPFSQAGYVQMSSALSFNSTILRVNLKYILCSGTLIQEPLITTPTSLPTTRTMVSITGLFMSSGSTITCLMEVIHQWLRGLRTTSRTMSTEKRRHGLWLLIILPRTTLTRVTSERVTTSWPLLNLCSRKQELISYEVCLFVCLID